MSRAKKLQSFNEFRNYFQGMVKRNSSDHSTFDKLSKHYSHYVDLNNGKRKDSVRFFFGDAPYDTIKPQTGVGQDQSIVFLVEEGANLVFSRDDRGRIHCFFYPFQSETQKPHEDFLLFKSYSNANKLLEPSGFEKCWDTFLSYAAVTSLRCELSFRDHLKGRWAQLSSKRYKGDKQMPSRTSVWLKSLWFLFITMALSWIGQFIYTLISGE